MHHAGARDVVPERLVHDIDARNELAGLFAVVAVAVVVYVLPLVLLTVVVALGRGFRADAIACCCCAACVVNTHARVLSCSACVSDCECECVHCQCEQLERAHVYCRSWSRCSAFEECVSYELWALVEQWQRSALPVDRAQSFRSSCCCHRINHDQNQVSKIKCSVDSLMAYKTKRSAGIDDHTP